MQALLTNSRAHREWAWIVSQVGLERATAALQQLGNRKPYPLNIARVLGLKLPTALAVDKAPSAQICGPSPEIKRHLDALKRRLQDKGT